MAWMEGTACKGDENGPFCFGGGGGGTGETLHVADIEQAYFFSRSKKRKYRYLLSL